MSREDRWRLSFRSRGHWNHKFFSVHSKFKMVIRHSDGKAEQIAVYMGLLLEDKTLRVISI